MRVKIDYNDGLYSFKESEDGNVEIPNWMWLDYQGHVREVSKWQQIICAIDNNAFEGELYLSTVLGR